MDQQILQRRSYVYHPVNIAILRAFQQRRDDRFMLDGETVESVEIVCRMDDLRETSIRYDFLFTDEFGGFPGVMYRRSDRKGLKGCPLSHRGYVSVVGSVKRFEGTVVLVVEKLNVVNCFKQVMNHRLRVVWAHRIRTGEIHMSSKSNPDSTKGQVHAEILSIVKRLNPYKNRRGVHKDGILSQLDSKLSAKDLERHLNELLACGNLSHGEQPDCYSIN